MCSSILSMTTRVYSKNGFIKTLYNNADSKIGEIHNELIDEGWIHTSTIDPAAWIESLMNNNTDHANDLMDELNFGPNPNHPIFI